MQKDELAAHAVDNGERGRTISHGGVVSRATQIVPVEHARVGVEHDEHGAQMEVDVAHGVGDLEDELLLELVARRAEYAQRLGGVQHEEAVIGSNQSLDRINHLDARLGVHRLVELVHDLAECAVDVRLVGGERGQLVRQRRGPHVTKIGVEALHPVQDAGRTAKKDRVSRRIVLDKAVHGRTVRARQEALRVEERARKVVDVRVPVDVALLEQLATRGVHRRHEHVVFGRALIEDEQLRRRR